MTRRFIFKNYWWLVILVASMALIGALYFGDSPEAGLIGSILATALAFCYFVQQQRLAETALFKDLFTEFNGRYDRLNEKLLDIFEKNQPFDLAQRKVVIDYFNLCAEEFLFFKDGYIHRDVWRSWCRGMLWYMTNEHFLDLWNREIKTESYYGLSIKDIQSGAD